MAEEKMIDKVVRLMKQPEKIRNIAICAHIDHGKCISGNSRLILNDGKIVTAVDMFKLAQNEGTKFEERDDYITYDVRDLNLKIPSINKETGKIEVKKIDFAWKLIGGEMIKIKLRNGFNISTTPEHKYIVLENADIVEKRAEDIKLGDRIVCPRRTNVETEINVKEEILLMLSKKRIYARLNEEFANNLKSILLEKGIKNAHKILNIDLRYHSFTCGIRKKRYLIKHLIEIAKMFDIGIKELYDNVSAISFRTGGWRGKSANSMSLPRNFEEFYYLAGLLIGDGTNKKFVVGKKELGHKFTNICKELGINVTFRNYPGKTPEIVTNQTLFEVMNSLFDYPVKNKSHTVKISEFLLNSPKKYSSKLLRGYFDTGGSVEKSRRAITISSASNDMINDLSLFLLRFGCIPIIEKDNTISISGYSLINYIDEIGFGLEEKSIKAHALAERMQGSHVSDFINMPIMQNGLITLQKSFNTHNQKKLIRFCRANDMPIEKLNKLLNGDLAFIEVKSLETTKEDFVYDFTIHDNHNFVAEGMFIHNTTFSDSLLAGAGMISEETAGKQLALDFRADEQARGITIDSASVSMVHNIEGEEYLINLIDTPGHVDFGGDVTRAMRAVDGAITLCDAVEGIMPQTETVLRQALRELVKPILFINKVDRLIREVKMTPEAMQERFIKIITNVNKFIESIAPEEYKQKWQVSVQDGSVCFGSAFHKWAVSFPYMKKHNITFKDIIDAYSNNSYQEFAKKAPLHSVVLNAVITHHPNPLQAQKYRIPKIWHGELESTEGKSLTSCDPNGPVAFIVTKIIIDKHAGEVATGRLFSGTMQQGQDVYMNMAKKDVRIQQVSVYKGAQRIQVDAAPAGNIIGVVGLKNTYAGETVSSAKMEPFEAIKHIFEPVVTKSIEAKSAADLPKLVEVLKQVGKEDPSISIKINEETGENLISGMGELHLEIIENRIKTEKGLNIITGQPIVVYRESIQKPSLEAEGKSPNKHNKFYFVIEPLEEEIYQMIKSGDISEGRVKKKETEEFKKIETLGISMKEAKKIRDIYGGNMFIDGTKGIVQINEVIELVLDGFEQVMDTGVLAKEPCTKMKVRLVDMKLHEDAIHRGPAQVYPAVRDGIRAAVSTSKPMLYEPVQILQIDAPASYLGDVSKLIQNKRGQLLEVNQEGEHMTLKCKLPVAEMFGMSNDLRSATGGRGNFFVIDQIYEKLPELLQDKVKKQIRDRKGLKEEE